MGNFVEVLFHAYFIDLSFCQLLLLQLHILIRHFCVWVYCNVQVLMLANPILLFTSPAGWSHKQIRKMWIWQVHFSYISKSFAKKGLRCANCISYSSSCIAVILPSDDFSSSNFATCSCIKYRIHSFFYNKSFHLLTWCAFYHL